MKRRDFIKTIAAAAAVAGLGRFDAAGAPAEIDPGAVKPDPGAPELHIHGNPYAFCAETHRAFQGAGYDFDPITAHALPPAWRDQYLLGIGA
jgi:hypothetical protein